MKEKYKNPFEDPDAEFYGKKVKDYKIPKRKEAPLEKKIPNIGDYIYVPTIKLYVAKERSLCGLSWENAHKKLHKQDLQMLTLRQFIDFIQYLQSNPNNRIQDAKKILDEIFGKTGGWKSEWLDGKFIEGADELYISYNHRTENGKLKAQNTELLENCLLGNPHTIDLKSCNRQGLPTKKGKDISYWPPSYGGSVIRFALSGAIIDCGWADTDFDSSLGVRAARKLKNKKIGEGTGAWK